MMYSQATCRSSIFGCVNIKREKNLSGSIEKLTKESLPPFFQPRRIGRVYMAVGAELIKASVR